MKKILVTTDGSECGGMAIEKAVELAKIYKSELVILYVDEDHEHKTYVAAAPTGASGMNPGVPGYNAGSVTAGAAVNVTEHEGEREISDKAEKILNSAKSKANALTKPVTTLSIRGSAAETIIDYVEDSDFDLVVMGSSSKTGLKRFFMGSVAAKVAKSIEKSILIVR